MRLLTVLLAITAFASPMAQTIEQTAGIYTAYPAPSGKYTPAPKGYQACYISHYGRHGSRWITDDQRYLNTIEPFDSAFAANGLTPLGLDVRNRLQRVNADAIGRSGSITPLGERQHHDIASRMYLRHPEVFADSAKVKAVSSTSLRCAMSMSFFTEGLKEHNPSLYISRSAYDKDMDYIAYTSPQGKAFSANDAEWRKEHLKLIRDIVKPQRLISSLFTDPDGMDSLRQYNIAMNLYWVASDMQNVDIGENFYDIFTCDELQALWRTINARMYACNGNYPVAKGAMLHCADNLLDDIISQADASLYGGSGINANLRFGHDTHLLRLLARMKIKGCDLQEKKLKDCHKVWRDYEMSPMAANLQLIFYKNEEGNVMVKLLLNENEVELPIPSPTVPYYMWDDVKKLWHE